jgi:hypothetical protein
MLIYFLGFFTSVALGIIVVILAELLFVFIVKVCRGTNSFMQRQVVPCTHRRKRSHLCLVKVSRITEQGIATKQLFSGSLSPKLSSTEKCLHYLPLTCGTCCGPENGCFAIVLYSLSFWCTMGIIPSVLTWAHGTAWIYFQFFETLTWGQPDPPQHQQRSLPDRISCKNDVVINYVTWYCSC